MNGTSVLILLPASMSLLPDQWMGPSILILGIIEIVTLVLVTAAYLSIKKQKSKTSRSKEVADEFASGSAGGQATPSEGSTSLLGEMDAGQTNERLARLERTMPSRPEPSLAFHATIDDHLRGLRDEISALTAKIGELPSLQTQEKRRLIERARREREGETERTTEANREALSRRLDVIYANPVFVLSKLAKEIIDQLTSGSGAADIEKRFGDYVRLVIHGLELRAKLSEKFGGNIEADCEALEKELETVSKNHRVVWFIDLLKEARRSPALQVQTEALKELLGIEEVRIAPGASGSDLKDLDVVVTEGSGRRTVISEVVEDGYLQKETGVVLRRPKVKVRLES